VICSLGISNIKNIELGRQEHVTICADNDGNDSHTHLVIERAAQALKAKGIKSIAIVRPKGEKQDFNDVLKEYGTQKIRSDIDPIINKSSNYQTRIDSIHQKLEDYRKEEKALQKVSCLEVTKIRRRYWQIGIN
jgi:Toprim domain